MCRLIRLKWAWGLLSDPGSVAAKIFGMPANPIRPPALSELLGALMRVGSLHGQRSPDSASAKAAAYSTSRPFASFSAARALLRRFPIPGMRFAHRLRGGIERGSF